MALINTSGVCWLFFSFLKQLCWPFGSVIAGFHLPWACWFMA
jgi:hypothetical protein